MTEEQRQKLLDNGISKEEVDVVSVLEKIFVAAKKYQYHGNLDEYYAECQKAREKVSK